jgi:uracil-DNA glycosylase
MQENINIIKKKLLLDFKISGWDTILNPFIESPAFDSITDMLSSALEKGRRFTPKFKDVFKPFIETKLSDLKVVIVNQDPYPQFGIADGLAFSCSNTHKEETSLKYIFDQLEKDFYEYERNVDLTRWANQGVLLINTTFTCEMNKMGSHIGIWKSFSQYLFEMINKKDKTVIFVLMGRKAEHWQTRLPGQIILKCPHPASAAYNKTDWKADDIFNKINNELEKQNKTIIQW